MSIMVVYAKKKKNNEVNKYCLNKVTLDTGDELGKIEKS